nr:tetratricopeptide repeat protein [Nostocaceae cyanobacterium]
MTNKTYTIPNSFRVVSVSITVAVALALMTSISTPCSAQSQPVKSAEQSVALKEAEDLVQKAIQLLNKGKYSAAIPLVERSLAIREKVLGKEHPLVAQSLNNLALLYQDEGNYQQAEP